MHEFELAYKKLNDEQKRAVDKTDGPVMVIAGPGTGKTQLLATRAANILRKDSTLLPTNILCLTFTENGQAAMQKRLIEIMGDAGAHVAVHTFHSFGAEIISRYPKYFYKGLAYQPSDALTSHEILLDIFDKLPHDSLLATTQQGEYVFLKHTKNRLQELKKAAISPDELRKLTVDGLAFSEYIGPYIVKLFDVPRFVSTEDINRAGAVLDIATTYRQKPITLPTFEPLSSIFMETFSAALDAAKASGKAKPLNDWKKPWYGKNSDKKSICKQITLHQKLLAFADIYEQYQLILDERRLFDFDDMIGRVVHALETNGELAYELQEQYQYFLVDEFQDTNAGQLRLLTALANHPVNESKPNVMVVGDDDQAIFAFQGAELSNILSFETSYADVETISLVKNYRSKAEILATARNLITQGQDRLETRLAGLSKELSVHGDVKGDVRVVRELFNSQNEEFYWLAVEVKELLEKGHIPSEIAVICREHKYLEALMPYLLKQSIPVWYERKQNALNNTEIKALILLARTVNAIAIGNPDVYEPFLPELLSAAYWQLSTEAIWRLGLASERSYHDSGSFKGWLEIMQESPIDSKLHSISRFLLEASRLAQTSSLETVLDILLGNTETAMADEGSEENETESHNLKLISPFKQFYFSNQILVDDPGSYIQLLGALTALRNEVRAHHNDEQSNLGDFITFIDLCISSKTSINVVPLTGSAKNSVQLMSAHGSKGLEFETVFVLSAQKDVWDTPGKAQLIGLAPNMLQIAHSGNQDDNLRIFYVAITRAKRQLVLTNHVQKTPTSKSSVPFAALEHEDVRKFLPSPSSPRELIKSASDELELIETAWQDRHYMTPAKSLEDLLSKRLESYTLSATHLNNFLDITNGGPQSFLLGNLLRFPSAMSPSSAYGDAVHKTLEQIHGLLIDTGSLPNQRVIENHFKIQLKHKHLVTKDYDRFLKRGIDALNAFMKVRGKYITTNQLPEQNFNRQGVVIDGARLTGKLDVLDIRGTNAIVIDYKTDKTPFKDWSDVGKSAYEKIKQHKYAQQLYFYKLLVDGSRSWGGKGIRANQGLIMFVEPKNNEVIELSLLLDNNDELDRLRALIEKVWQHIQNLNFPDTNNYKDDITGIKAFEDDLLGDKI